MKKMLGITLAAILSISMLTACGGGGGASQAPPAQPPAQSGGQSSSGGGSAPAAAEPVTINFYTWEASLDTQHQALVAEFERLNPDIKVNIVYPVENNSSEYTQKIDLLLLTNEQIDVMAESSVARMTSKVDREMYMPLNNFIEAEGIVYEDVYTVSSLIDGSYYAFPFDVTPWFVMMNKSKLDAAGLPIPPLNWTWDDYRDYAAKLTTGSGTDKEYGSYFHTWNNYYLMGRYSTKMDNAMYNDDGSLGFDSPAFRDWLQFRYDMENVDGSSTPLIDVKTAQMAYRNEFWSGRAAMLPTGAWMLTEIKDTENWPRDFQVAFAPLPRWSNGGVEGRTFSDTKMISVPVSAKYPEQAYRFARFYSNEGLYIRAGGLVALKNTDMETNINTLIESPNVNDLYHLDSLYAVFKNPKLVYNAPLIAPVYDSEISTMFIEESDKFMVGGVTLDSAIQSIMTMGNDIIRRATQ